MEHKRDGLVSIGEASTGPVGTVEKILRDDEPRAVHQFTSFDQVNQLVAASESDPDLGFMARMMLLCSLPRSNPGNRYQYKRVNGPYKLYMQAGPENKLPYGNIPRLLLVWMCTEAVRTQSRELTLGDSVSEFMRKLGIYSTSGGVYIRLRNQMKRLFTAHVQLVYEDQHGEAIVSSSVADRMEFWWNPKRPAERSLWESKIRLGEDFFSEVLRHPVPVDMNTLKALKRSSLGLDWYLWLTYRTFTLRRPVRLSWKQLYRQFGVNPAKAQDKLVVNDFRKDCLRELKKIKLAWPGLNYRTGKGVLFILPSKPAIPPTHQLRVGE